MIALGKLNNVLKSPRMHLALLLKLLSFSFKILTKSNMGQLKVISENEFTEYYTRSSNQSLNCNFRERWTQATSLAKAGKYTTALTLRRTILEEAKSSIGWESGAIPVQLESAFVSHYGHLALLSYVKVAATESLIPPRVFQIQASKSLFQDRPLLRCAVQGIQVAKINSPNSIFDHDALFGMTEKNVMVTGHHDYLDIHQIINDVEKNGSSKIRDAFFSVVSEFEMNEFENLCEPMRRIGYEWFVCVQVRKSNGKDFIRNNSLSDFQSIFRYVRQLGGFVIVIGNEVGISDLVLDENIIDLRDRAIARPYLIDLAIAMATYFIGPESGPTTVAVSLGVPTLRANGVGVLANSYTTHAPSVSLPKYWTDTKGTRVNWMQVIETDLGFCEEDRFELGYSMKSNSPEDLLFAFQELVQLTEFSNTKVAPLENLHLAQVKADRSGFGDGLLSSQFFK